MRRPVVSRPDPKRKAIYTENSGHTYINLSVGFLQEHFKLCVKTEITTLNAFYINCASQSSQRKALIMQGLPLQFVLLALGGFGECFHLTEVCDAPLGKFIEDRADGAAEIGKRVLDLWRHLAIDVSLDEAERFKLAELLREHLFGDGSERTAELAEPHRRGVVELPENAALPFSAEHLDAGFDRAKAELNFVTFLLHTNYLDSITPCG